MKMITEMVIFSIVLGTAYGVLFSMFYPLVSMNTRIVATLAFAGVVSSVILVSLWKMIRGK